MDKKTIMNLVAVVCIVLAGIIFFSTRGGGSSDLREFQGVGMWAICMDNACGEKYQTDQAEYFRFVQANQTGDSVPPMPCEKCGRNSVFRAEKCPQCETVFRRGSVPFDYPDRCPQCGHSDSAAWETR